MRVRGPCQLHVQPCQTRVTRRGPGVPEGSRGTRSLLNGSLVPAAPLATCPAPCLARGDTGWPRAPPHSSPVTRALMWGWDHIWIIYCPNVSTHHPQPAATDASTAYHTRGTRHPNWEPHSSPPASHSSPITQTRGIHRPPRQRWGGLSAADSAPPRVSPSPAGPAVSPRLSRAAGATSRGRAGTGGADLCRGNADTPTSAPQDRAPGHWGPQ